MLARAGVWLQLQPKSQCNQDLSSNWLQVSVALKKGHAAEGMRPAPQYDTTNTVALLEIAVFPQVPLWALGPGTASNDFTLIVMASRHATAWAAQLLCCWGFMQVKEFFASNQQAYGGA